MKAYRPLNITKYDPFLRPVPAPGAHPDEPNFLCVSFNENWLPHILGALEPLRWTDKYQGDDATRELAARRAENLIYLFMSAIPCEVDEMRLRQKPGEPCVLQASYDTGNTWVDVFDYALCFDTINRSNPPSDYVLTYNTYQQYMTEARALYAGDPANLTPQGSVEIDPANLHKPICVAARAVVLGSCAVGIEAANADESTREDFYSLVSAGFAVSALVAGSSIIFPPVAASIGISAAIGGKLALGMSLASIGMGLTRFFDNEDTSIFEDEALQREVICCMTSALGDTIPTGEEFRQSLDNCSLSGNAEELRSVVREIIQSPDVYINFLLEIEGAYQGAMNSGIDLGTCPCDSWCQYWLGDNDGTGLTISGGVLTTTSSTFIQGPPVDVAVSSATPFMADTLTITFDGIGSEKAATTIYKQTAAAGTWETVTTASRGNGAYSVEINEQVFGLRVYAHRLYQFEMTGFRIDGNGNEPTLNGTPCP